MTKSSSCKAIARQAAGAFKTCWQRAQLATGTGSTVEGANTAALLCMGDAFQATQAATKGDCRTAGYRLQDATRSAREAASVFKAKGWRTVRAKRYRPFSL